MRSDRIIKFIATICFALIILGALAVWNSPATGYEPSIYTATPSTFWRAVIFGLTCGISIVVHQIYTRQHEQGHLWILGITLVFTVYAAILSLWIVRGYALWCPGDPLTHLGKIQDVIATGHIKKGEIYPIVHIYSAQIAQIFGVGPIAPHKYLPFLFGLLNALFFYLFSKSILSEKGQVILATLASMTFLQGWYLNLTPNHLSNLFFPLALFMLVKSFSQGTSQWRLLLAIIVFLFPPFHPVPAFALLIVMLTIGLFDSVKSIFKKELLTAVGSTFDFNISIPLLLFVWWVIWVSYSSDILGATIRKIYTVITMGGLTHLDILVEQIQYGAMHGYSVGEQFFKLYGGIVVLILLALIALPILWRRTFTDLRLRKLSSLYGPLGAFSLATLVLYFLYVGFGPLRMMVYIVILCTMFAGFMLYEIMRVQNFRRANYIHWLRPLLVVIIVVALFTNGILKLYPSRHILEANWQITRTEITGMGWFLNQKNTNVDMTSLSIPIGRFAHFLLTSEGRARRQDLKRLSSGLYVPENLKVPFHFGYDRLSTLGYWYSEDIYLVLNEKDRRLYQEVFPEIAELRFLPEDFVMLEHDLSVDKLYSNGGFDSYYIHGIAHASEAE